MRLKALTLLLVLALSTAGCLGGADDTADPSPAATDTGGDVDADVPGNATNGTDANVTDKDEMPHVHDYWFGKEKVTIFDQEVEFNAFNTFANVFFAGENAVGGAFLELPEGTIVYEGTGEMDITVTWTDATMHGVSLYYKSAADGDLSNGPVEFVSGEPATVPVTPEMTDLPHSRVSKWAFYFIASGSPPVAVGSAHVTITLHKMRDIQEFPAHPDFWENTTRIPVMDVDGSTEQENAAVRLARIFTEDYQEDGEAPPKGSIVPMGTKALIANLTITSANMGPAMEMGNVYLFYRTAASWEYHRADLINQEERTYTYLIPVEPGTEDSPYAEESMWRFYPRASAAVQGTPVCGGCFDYEMEYHLTVTAYPVENP